MRLARGTEAGSSLQLILVTDLVTKFLGTGEKDATQ